MHILKVYVELVKRKDRPQVLNYFPKVCWNVLKRKPLSKYILDIYINLFETIHFFNLGDNCFLLVCIGECEEGKEEGRKRSFLFYPKFKKKKKYFEVWASSLNKQKKDIHSHVEKCVGAMEHGQVMLLGMVFTGAHVTMVWVCIILSLPLAAFSSGPWQMEVRHSDIFITPYSLSSVLNI